MRFTWQARMRGGRAVLATLALAGGLASAVPVTAQDNTDSRVRKLESEVKALQRKVFPGPDGKFFEPEVSTGPTQGTVVQQPLGPTPSALTDVLQRLDSIEAQLNQLTARSEVSENALSKLEARVDMLEKAGAAPSPAAPTDDSAAASQPTGAIPVPDTVERNLAVMKTPAKASPTSSKAGAKPTAARLAKVQAVTKPDTGNDGDDEYSYGFRLFQAGLYPEAQQQLKIYVDKYPKDPKISYGRNLLGRAYLDDKQPKAAAPFFLENYQKDPNGARAADSLLFLAESMVALKDNTRACRALAEFGEKYAALATGRLQNQYDKDRQQAACK